MLGIGLQIGCMIISAYLIASYIKGTREHDIKCSRIFEHIMIITPVAIFFDGATALSVNQLDRIPMRINIVLHACYLIMMAVTIMFTFLYVISQTVEIRKTRTYFLMSIPGIISIITIILTMDSIQFAEGPFTNYSTGFPAYICYLSVAAHFTAIYIILFTRKRTLEKNKIIGIFMFLGLSLLAIILQGIFPQLLLTSVCSTVILLGIYTTFEDPANKKLEHYNSEVVTSFATLVENRDDNTGGHIKRTAYLVKRLLSKMRKTRKYRKILTKDYIKNVINAAPMHDIGKIATPDAILQKPGKLDDNEYEIMKLHAGKGGEIIKETFGGLDDPDFLNIAYEVARHHHEKWNGKGYPDGLAREDIPLHARVMAIADVFDAVSADRCYRKALPLDTCFQIIEEGAGVDFDPYLVGLFIDMREEIEAYVRSENASLQKA